MYIPKYHRQFNSKSKSIDTKLPSPRPNHSPRRPMKHSEELLSDFVREKKNRFGEHNFTMLDDNIPCKIDKNPLMEVVEQNYKKKY